MPAHRRGRVWPVPADGVGGTQRAAVRRPGRAPSGRCGLGLVIRGPHRERVLEAAAEVLAEDETLRADSRPEELSALVAFGEAEEIEVDMAKHDAKLRFAILPACHVCLGAIGHSRISAAGRPEGSEADLSEKLRRIVDMSRRRHDSVPRNEAPNLNTAG